MNRQNISNSNMLAAFHNENSSEPLDIGNCANNIYPYKNRTRQIEQFKTNLVPNMQPYWGKEGVRLSGWYEWRGFFYLEDGNIIYKSGPVIVYDVPDHRALQHLFEPNGLKLSYGAPMPANNPVHVVVKVRTLRAADELDDSIRETKMH